MLWRLTPLLLNIYLATAVFSHPWSDLTRDGSPYLATAILNGSKTVEDLLSVEHLRYTIHLLKPSIAP